MSDETTDIFVVLYLEVPLTVNEVWPDGDAPETVTAEAIIAQMKAGGDKVQVLKDWNLLRDLEVQVNVNRLGPPAPQMIYDQAEWV